MVPGEDQLLGVSRCDPRLRFNGLGSFVYHDCIELDSSRKRSRIVLEPDMFSVHRMTTSAVAKDFHGEGMLACMSAPYDLP